MSVPVPLSVAVQPQISRAGLASIFVDRQWQFKSLSLPVPLSNLNFKFMQFTHWQPQPEAQAGSGRFTGNLKAAVTRTPASGKLTTVNTVV